MNHLHISEIEDPITGMTRDLSPTALCNDFSSMNILLKSLLVTILWLCPHPVKIRTKLALSLIA